MLAATSYRFALACVVAAAGVSAASLARSTEPSATGQINLLSGDYYRGVIADTDEQGSIAWQTEFASKPFVFPLEKVKSAAFPTPGDQPKSKEQFCFELQGGQAIFANLVSASDDQIVIESDRFGRLILRKGSIARFYRARGNRSGLGDGLQGLSGWTVEGVAGDWREEAGDLVSEMPGAAISQRISVPTKFWVEIDAEWNRDYGIQFEFGDVFRIESWKEHVILARDPKARPLLPAADTESAEWKYTFKTPPDDWEKPDFDDSSWEKGKSGFGSAGEPFAGTPWDTNDIWIRRTVDIPRSSARPQLYIRHDEDATVYINGVLAAHVPSFVGSYEVERISDEALAAIKPKDNVIAVHCHQTGGGQFIDVGLVAGGGGEADFASIKRPKGASGLHVRCFVNRQTGEVKVVDLAGNTLSKVALKPNAALEDGPYDFLLRLISYTSRLRVKQLVVGEWDGSESNLAADDGLKVRLKDGGMIKGDSLEAVQGSDGLVVVSDGSRHSLATEEIEHVTFATRDYESPSPYWLNLHDGAVLSGDLKGVKDGNLRLESSLAEHELRIPVADVRSLANVAPPVAPRAEPQPAHSIQGGQQQRAKPNGAATLEAEGVLSHGQLVEATASERALGMAWQPCDSAKSAPLTHDAQVRILLRDESKSSLAAYGQAPIASQPYDLPRPSLADNEPSKADRRPAPGLNGAKQYVVLANGDRIECRVTKFDETGLDIESELASEQFISADKVRVWETNEQTWLESMDEEKRRRLMTLPRKQREHPPTHMVESVTSDFLRTRIVKADNQRLYVLAQMKERTIPRAAVQRVVWLPSTDPKKKATAGSTGKLPVTTASTRVDDAKALLDDSMQLTMKVEGLANGKLVGESAILGQCTVNVERVLELRLGGISAERAASSLAQWRLHDAIDPIYMQDQELEENGRLTAGLNFPLVGKPAPDFSAPTLAGDPVKLSELRGQVVVLDFWASWCGPCIQAFPEIVALAGSYDESKVRLISVNLGEDKETMQACLDRLQLSPTVAMDLDRFLAERYQVKSIPQTVVIDAKGGVARVFVGATPQLPKQLRFAIDELLAQ
jgi:thiol-disulfide isomerase/thioredoxin